MFGALSLNFVGRPDGRSFRAAIFNYTGKSATTACFTQYAFSVLLIDIYKILLLSFVAF